MIHSLGRMSGNFPDFIATGISGVVIAEKEQAIVLGTLNMLDTPPGGEKMEGAIMDLIKPSGIVFEQCLGQLVVWTSSYSGVFSRVIAKYINPGIWIKDGPVSYRKDGLLELLRVWKEVLVERGEINSDGHDDLGEVEGSSLLHYLTREIAAKLFLHSPTGARLNTLLGE